MPPLILAEAGWTAPMFGGIGDDDVPGSWPADDEGCNTAVSAGERAALTGIPFNSSDEPAVAAANCVVFSGAVVQPLVGKPPVRFGGTLVEGTGMLILGTVEPGSDGGTDAGGGEITVPGAGDTTFGGAGRAVPGW